MANPRDNEVQKLLKKLAKSQLSIEMTEIAELIGTGKKQITMAQVPIADAAAYAAADADAPVVQGHPARGQGNGQGLFQGHAALLFHLAQNLVDKRVLIIGKEGRTVNAIRWRPAGVFGGTWTVSHHCLSCPAATRLARSPGGSIISGTTTKLPFVPQLLSRCGQQRTTPTVTVVDARALRLFSWTKSASSTATVPRSWMAEMARFPRFKA